MESSSLRKVQPHPRHTSTQAQCPPTLHEHHTHTTSLTIPETQLLPVCPINKRHSDELAPLLFCKRFYHPPAPPSLVKSVYKSTVGSIPAPSKSAIDTVGTIGSLTKAPLHSTTDNETSRFEAMLGHLNALQLSQTLSLPSLPSLPSLYSQHPTQFLRKKRVFERYFQHDTEQEEDAFHALYKNTAIPLPASVKCLTEEENKRVDALLTLGQHGTIAQMKTAVVEYKDIYKLHPEVWLNDEIINFYMEMLSDRSKENTGVLPDIHCFNTFFYSTIRESGYSKVKRWTKRVDIFAKDLVFVPINQSLHWVLAVFDMKRTLVRVYDSLGGGHDYTLKLLLNYLREEHLDKKKKVLDTSDWTLESPKNIPHQKNGSDCGVFTCTFAERLSRNLPFDFTQKDMVLIRRRMVFDISQKHIS